MHFDPQYIVVEQRTDTAQECTGIVNRGKCKCQFI